TLFPNLTPGHSLYFTEYVQQLFPLFGPNQTEAVASNYQSFGSPLDQVNAIMGESTFICPTYNLLRAFPGKSYKGEYAVPPALHADDMFYYFPSFTFSGLSKSFNNTTFTNAFTQGFLSFVVHLDPDDKLRPSITPEWPTWAPTETEMVFNRTEGGVPSIAGVPTWNTLLGRCKCVLLASFFLVQWLISTGRFWKSLIKLTAQ
ncbi:hypothetical protein DFH07DRAFT_743696, partial [Mycena maculata]